MDGVAFQGMPRIALTPAEEALLPRPPSSASQVATAIPSAYSRSTTPQNRHHLQYPHPYGRSSPSRPPSPFIPSTADYFYSRPSSPAPPRPSSPAPPTTSITPASPPDQEQEYPQNPPDGYYSQIPPPRSASPGPSRLAFALNRPTRSPSPQLYNSLYHRPSYDVHPRPGSPLQQEHQDSWGNSVRMESPDHSTNDSDRSSGNESDNDNDNEDDQTRTPNHPRPRLSARKSILRRLKETTTRLSFGDDAHRPSRASLDSDRGASSASASASAPPSTAGGGGSASGIGGSGPRRSQDSQRGSNLKEVLQDLSDEERQQAPRKSRSGWRPSLSLIRQESSNSNSNYYLQNDPNRISGNPNSTPDNKPKRDRSKAKGSRKTRRAARERKRAKRAAKEKLAYENQLEATMVDLSLPSLDQVLDKKTRFPLSYDDFEAFLRTQRAVEYLNFWADVAAHEQLCRTFDVSERRHKREQQLEERAIARDKRRMALMTAMENGRLTPDPDLLTPGQALSIGTGIGIGASGQEIEGSSMYLNSRSSLQLPLNDHLSFPQETRRYAINDSSAPYPPMPPSHPQHSNQGSGVYPSGSYNRILAGASGMRQSGEQTRSSLEDPDISEQDAVVAAVAMRAQKSGMFPYREDDRRGSFDVYRPMPGGAGMPVRFQQNGDGSMAPLPSSLSSPNAYNLMMRGRGSIDVLNRSNSRTSRIRPPASEDYFGNGIRRTTSQQFQHPQHRSSSPAPPTQQPSPQDENPPITTDQDNETALQRKSSVSQFGGGLGPLQAPVSIRRSGESAYAPSIFSNGQEGKALLALSYRTISLEDLQESALRIYRKYLIQLRTASMAAEEEVANAAALQEASQPGGTLGRNSLDKGIAPGWDGYAEEVIAQWNENWRGRSREARRSRRLSRRASSRAAGQSSRYGGYGEGGQTDHPPNEKNGPDAPRNGLTINTAAAMNGGNEKAESDNRSENGSQNSHGGKASVPASPMSARMRKRAGTGLSAVLSPLLSRLMRTETTVVELPTLTINTTTIEEIPDDSDDSDYSDDEDSEDYDSDEEDNTDEEAGEQAVQAERDKNKEPQHKEPQPKVYVTEAPSTKDEDEEVVAVLERSMSVYPSYASEPFQLQRVPNILQSTVVQIDDPEEGAGAGHGTMSRRSSSCSSLSSSWDRITKRDLEKSVTIVPHPTNSSFRPSPYRRHGGIRRVRDRAGKAGMHASKAASKFGWQMSTLLKKAPGSSSSSLDVIQVSPLTSPRIEARPSEFRFSIPEIVMDASFEQQMSEKFGGDLDGGRKEEEAVGPLDNVAHQAGHRMPSSGTSTSIVQLQGEPIQPLERSSSVNAKQGLQSDTLTLPPSKPFVTPQTSSISNQPTGSASPSSSLTPSMAAHRLSVSSPAAIAASAVAAAFYLPLECRQRIHTQVQVEGRTEAPYLFGPAKGFVTDVVLRDHYYPLFLKYVEQQNLGLLNQDHPNNQIKRRGMLWVGIGIWIAVSGVQLTLALLGLGGWSSPWVWVLGTVGGWTGLICLATGLKGFSPVLGLMGKMTEDKHLFRTRRILEPSIRVGHRKKAMWMLSACVFWSTVVMVIFAALPQAQNEVETA